jgi:hypothetical protein
VARTRNLKPGFFTNDVLAEVAPLGRLLFAGLWCHADREGRLEDRCKKLKAQILPFDDVDVDALLGELAKRGFIVRYTVGADGFIQVAHFAKHQNPHVKEQASTIPASDKPGASTRQEPYEPGLLPSSLTLIPQTDAPGKAQASAFPVFWKAYPKKHSPKQPALDKWICKRLDAHVDEIVADVEWRKQHDEEWKTPKYIPNAATYLNQKRWLDDRPEKIVEQKRVAI